jgi:hypothetical protein
MLSVADSPAKILVKPENGPVLKTELEADFGLNTPELSMNCGPDSPLSKTSLDSLITDSNKCSTTLPKSGMMRNGIVSAHLTWVPRIAGSASSLLLTPIEMDGSGGVSTMVLGYKRATPHGFGSLSEQLNVAYGLRPDAAFMEMMMGYPDGWTQIEGQP